MNAPTDVSTASASAAGDRIEIERLFASARDALTDDIVTRLSGTVTGGLDLLDRVNRSGIAKALPAITKLVENGDLDRLASLVRVVGALEDSLSDDIVNRLAVVATALVTIVDKLARNPGFLQLIDVLGREDVQCGLMDLAKASCAAKKEVASLPPPSTGLMSLLRTMQDPGVLSSLRYLSHVAAHMRALGGQSS